MFMEENKIKIRYYKFSELDKIISLTSEAYSVPYRDGGVVNSFSETLDGIEKDISRGLKILVAEEKNGLIGAVRFAPINSKLKLGRLAVLSEHRRRGIGSKLIEAVIKIAKNQKFKVIALDVMEEKELIPFYEKFGFEIKSRQIHQNHHDVFMERVI